MNLFVDTNIVVANVFLLNSLHDKSKIVFNKYLNIFWSATVKKEFKKVFTFKLNILTNFYLKLYYYFLNFPVMEFTESKFYSIVKNIDFDNFDEYKKGLETLNSFWLRFVNNSLTSLDAIIEAIRQCITNLCGETHKCSKELENTIKLTDLRLEKYEKLHDVLKDYGVHYPDDEIILDAFDFNINHCPNLDFITFDENLYKAVSSIDTFSFKHVKGRFDYLGDNYEITK